MADNGIKLTFNEAIKLIKASAENGYNQDADFNTLKYAQRVVIAYRIKAERTSRGISQETFSKMVGSNSLTYRGYENCKSDIPIIYLIRIADALELSLDYLTGRTDIKEGTEKSLEERVKRLEELLDRTAKTPLH